MYMELCSRGNTQHATLAQLGLFLLSTVVVKQYGIPYSIPKDKHSKDIFLPFTHSVNELRSPITLTSQIVFRKDEVWFCRS